MKKVFYRLIILFMINLFFLISTNTVLAEEDDVISGKAGRNITYSYSKATNVLTFSGSGVSYDRTEWDGQDSSSELYAVRSKITEIKFENYTATNVPQFAGFSNLEKINIPEGVTSLQYYEQFKNCTKLKNVSLPTTLESIDYGAFQNCVSLESITIPAGVTEIGWFAFNGCTSLKEIEIPNGVEELVEDVFRDCTSLENVKLPNSLTKISCYAFYGCSSLTQISIPDSVTSITYKVFQKCDNLSVVHLGQKISEIDADVFDYSDNVKLYVVCGSYPEEYATKYSIEYVIESHNLNHVAAAEATCNAKGNIEYWICKGCNTKFDKDKNAISDTMIEINKSNHVGETELKGAEEATCSAEGYTGDVYCKACGCFISSGEAIAKKSHEYVNPTFKWSDDNKTCQITYVCKNDSSHIVIYDCIVTSKVKTEATCVTKGVITYTATYGTDTDIKEVQDIAINPANHSGDAEIRDSIEATCGEEGYTGDTYCKTCGNLISSGEAIVKTSHKYVNPVFSWSSDYKSCKVTFTCQNDSSHSVTFDCKVSSSVKTKATCTTKGITRYTAKYGDHTDIVDLENIPLNSNNHVWNATKTIDVMPTKTSVGYESTHCKYCTATKDKELIPAVESSAGTGKVQKITFKCNLTYKYKKLKKSKIKFKLNAKSSCKITSLDYKVIKGKSKYIKVSKSGVVTLKKGCKKGTYKIRVIANATKKYKKTSAVILIKVK